MNERIKELYGQSVALFLSKYTTLNPAEVWFNTHPEIFEIFAKLMVKDCVDIVNERKDQAIDMDWNVDESMSCAAMHIEEYFGVEH